jgi:hypothetical protein
VRVIVVCGLLAAVSPASAQTTSPAEQGLEVRVGGGWLAGAALGARDATLRQNTTPREPLRLFRSETRLASAVATEVAAGYVWGGRWAVEGGLVLAHPDVRSSLSADVEGASAVTVSERLDQYIVEGRLLILLDALRLGRRTVPFLSVGAGYVRQLHEGRTLVEEGRAYHLGGGLKHRLWSRQSGVIKGAGLRADARLYFMAEGVSFDDGLRRHGWVSGAAFVGF